MSNVATVMDGGGKYHVKMEKRTCTVSGAVRYYADICPVDRGSSITLVFDTLDQASAFLGDMTQAVLACATKAGEPKASES